MKDVKVLGPGCKRCEATEQMVRAEAAKLGVEVNVEKVTDYAQIAGFRRRLDARHRHRRQSRSRRRIAEDRRPREMASRLIEVGRLTEPSATLPIVETAKRSLDGWRP